MASNQPTTTQPQTRRGRLRLLAALVAASTTLLGVGYRINANVQAHRRLAEMYPRVEQLVAIYSVVAWRKPGQPAPHMKEDSEWGGREYQLGCTDVDWNAASAKPGELFDCFGETVKKSFDGETFDAPRITRSGDFWYRFAWESLFGYEVEVTLFPEASGTLQTLQDKIHNADTCKGEGSAEEARELCAFTTYQVKIDGLTESKEIAFLVADGYATSQSDGGVNRRYEWVVYINDTAPITVGALNKFIQLTARRMQFTDVELTRVVPMLEATWMNSDRAFLDGLFTEIGKAPDLMRIADFLKGK